MSDSEVPAEPVPEAPKELRPASFDDLFVEAVPPTAAPPPEKPLTTPASKPPVPDAPSSSRFAAASGDWPDGHIDHTYCNHGPWSGPPRASDKNAYRESSGSGYIHGPECGHAPPPKNKNAAWWTIGAAVVVGVVYLINQYGKKSAPSPTAEEKPWTARLEHPETNMPYEQKR